MSELERWHGRVLALRTTEFDLSFETGLGATWSLAPLSAADRAWLEKMREGCRMDVVIEQHGYEQTARLEFPRATWTQVEVDGAVHEAMQLERLVDGPTEVSPPDALPPVR